MNILKVTATVKQHYNMKEAAATNGPEGTVSKKTQVSLELLEQGMALLQNNLKSINQRYLSDVDLRMSLTTIVENLHAVSHFKNETFTALPLPFCAPQFRSLMIFLFDHSTQN